MPHTPRSDSETTRKPGHGTTAHRDLDGLDEASSSGRGGPDVRANADEHADDARRPSSRWRRRGRRSPVRTPIGRRPSCRTSATSGVSTRVMTTPMITAPTIASAAIVVYWRLTNASAPSRIVPATACISGVPVSRDSTSRARYRAKSTAVIPAIGINSWSALASIRVVGSSTGRCDRHPMRGTRACAVAAGVRGVAAGPRRHAPLGGTFQAAGECNKALIGGSNSAADRKYASPTGADRPQRPPPGAAPILPDL